jgi:hypothetical protein
MTRPCGERVNEQVHARILEPMCDCLCERALAIWESFLVVADIVCDKFKKMEIK